MELSTRKKRKNRSSGSNSDNRTKNSRVGGSPGGQENFIVSELLQEPNSILYNSDNSEVFISGSHSPAREMASNNQPGIVDVMKFLERIEGQLTEVNVKLKTLD